MRPTELSFSTLRRHIGGVETGIPQIEIVGAYAQSTESGLADTTVQFGTRDHGYLYIIAKADTSAEKRKYGTSTGTETKLENIGTCEQERPLFRKEQGKTREVGLSAIDFGLAKVCIHGKGGQDIGTDALVGIKAHVRVEHHGTVRSGLIGIPDQ